jgi:hypothetical protein
LRSRPRAQARHQEAKAGAFAYVVVVLENPDRFAIRLTEQNSSIGLFAVTESRCTEDEHDDEDEDDSKFRNLGLRACLRRVRYGLRPLQPMLDFLDGICSTNEYAYEQNRTPFHVPDRVDSIRRDGCLVRLRKLRRSK